MLDTNATPSRSDAVRAEITYRCELEGIDEAAFYAEMRWHVFRWEGERFEEQQDDFECEGGIAPEPARWATEEEVTNDDAVAYFVGCARGEVQLQIDGFVREQPAAERFEWLATERLPWLLHQSGFVVDSFVAAWKAWQHEGAVEYPNSGIVPWDDAQTRAVIGRSTIAQLRNMRNSLG